MAIDITNELKPMMAIGIINELKPTTAIDITNELKSMMAIITIFLYALFTTSSFS